KSREDRKIRALPGHADEDVLEAEDDGHEDQCRITHTGNPAAGHEGVEIGIVGVFRKVFVELQRPDAEWQIKRHLGAKNVAAEPAKASFVIALVEARALAEHFCNRV